MEVTLLIWMFAGLAAFLITALVSVIAVSAMVVCVVACIRLLEGGAQ